MGKPLHHSAHSPFRAVIRNASYLGSSKVVSALLGLVALGCAGRGMTPELFGSLVVVLAYVEGVSDLVKFQTWQFIVRYGTPALVHKDLSRFRNVTGFSFGLDIASSVVACAGGVALLPLIASKVGIQPQDLGLALFYCTLIPIMTAATPTGILRAIDRFDLIAIQQLVNPLLQAAGSIASLFLGWGFTGFLLSWYFAKATSGAVLWIFAIRELRLQGIRGALRPGLFKPARTIPKAWDFVWTTNFAHSIWAAWGPGSNLVVAAILGPAATGMFKIALTFYESAGKPADLMAKSFYPEIMRLDPSSKKPWLLAVRSSAIAAGVALLMAAIILVGGQPLIAAVFGMNYGSAYTLLAIMSGALIVSMTAFPLESLLYMASRQRAALAAEGFAALIYGGTLFMLTSGFGLKGAAISYVAGQCLKAGFSLIPTLFAYLQRHTLDSGAWVRS